jgi:hypothetical protein
MGDDLIAGGILPVDDTSSDEKEFDPDALESDDLLDDFIEDPLLSEELALGDEDDEESPFADEME